MRPTKKKLKAPFVMTSAAAAAVSLLVACGGKLPGGASSSGEISVNPPGPGFPGCTSSPRPGDPCAADASACAKSGNGEPTFTCEGGRWVEQPPVIGNPPPPPETPQCPANEPADGLACSPYGVASCSYLDRCSARPSTAPAARSYQCLDYHWTRTSPDYVAACPIAPPLAGESCEPCSGSYPAQCAYQGNSGCPSSFACDPKTLTWSANASSCNPPPPDGGI